MVKGTAFKDVLEGDAVARFMQSFVLPANQRADMQKKYPDADLTSLPETLDQVKADVCDIWRDRGYISPAELKNELIQKYMPDADPIVRKFVQAIELSRNQPEAVTGYLSKEHAYLATGLAHLYALETDMPMAMVEIDFSNMGGTNAYFRNLLAQEEGVTPEQIVPRRAELMTDKAMRLLSAAMTDEIVTQYPEERVIPIRTGGDELRILVTGLSAEGDIAALSTALHARIEKHVAGMGLQDHPHFKAPDDPARNGFGAAVAIQDMAEIINPETLIQELDGTISANKQLLGLMRLGKIDEETVEAEIGGKILTGVISVPDNKIMDVISAAVKAATHNAALAARQLHDMNPAHNPALQGGSVGFESYVQNNMPGVSMLLFKTATVPDVLAQHPLGGEYRPEGMPPMASLDDRYMALSARHFEKSGVMLGAGHHYLLRQSVQGLTPEDPSAEVMMPVGILKSIDNISADTPDFQRMFDPKNGDVQNALKAADIEKLEYAVPQGMAVSFHNLAGLNGALGHHNADLVLRHMAQHIIEDALHHAGVPVHENAAAMAHHGGGNFTVLLYPGGMEADGKPWFVSPKVLNAARLEIKERVQALNQTNIVDFLDKNSVQVTPALADYLKNEQLSTFADIQDPKLRSVVMDGVEKEYRVNGIHAVVTTETMTFDSEGRPAMNGGAFIGRVRNAADRAMEELRTSAFFVNANDVTSSVNGNVLQDYSMAFNETARLIRKAMPLESAPAAKEGTQEPGKTNERFRFTSKPEKKQP